MPLYALASALLLSALPVADRAHMLYLVVAFVTDGRQVLRPDVVLVVRVAWPSVCVAGADVMYF
jgi:hypothetical protein